MAQHSVRISTPTGILDAVPFLIGANPTESLVALVVDHTRRVALTARFDLPDTLPLFSQTLEYLRGVAQRYDAERVILVAYTDRARLGDHVLLFLGDNWRSSDAGEMTMTISANPDGWALITDTADVEREPYHPGTLVPAELVAAGMAMPHADQEQTRERYSRQPAEADVAALHELMDAQRERAASMTVEQRKHEVAEYVRLWDANQGTLAVCDAAYLVAMMGDNVDVRDAAMLSLTLDNAARQMPLWEYVARHVDGTAALPVLAIWGVAAWLTGSGLAANGVLERMQATPGSADYLMTSLLAEILHNAVPPEIWNGMHATGK